MSRTRFLTQREVNDRFYAAVDPEAAFVTEVQIGFHQVAVARLLARHAALLGLQVLAVLELGASTCLFANAFLQAMEQLVLVGEASLEAIRYTAVDYSRAALGAALRMAEEVGSFAEIKRVEAPAGAGDEEIAVLAQLRRPGVELALVRADAEQFVRRTPDRFDVVIANELLDDLPSRLFYADLEGGRHEISARACDDGEKWRVRVDAKPAPEKNAAALPPGTLTSTSEESVRVLKGADALLDRGGVILIHDYGFLERFPDATQYAKPQPVLPPFVELEFPDLPGVPRSFFRVFGNDEAHAIQITNDVNFSEVTELLRQTGTVIALPHGTALVNERTWPQLFFKGDGVFLSEFMTLTADDDLPALLAELHGRQRELWWRYATSYGSGYSGFFGDVIYIKG
jgi:hypothetical protein